MTSTRWKKREKEFMWKGKLKGCTAISLPYSNIAELSGVERSNLELLILLNEDPSFQVSDTFFKDMKNLKVLSVTGMSFPSLPSSFDSVENLQTLRLCECKLSELRMIEKLKKLDILSFQGSSIKQLPVEIAQLTQLKLLDLSECSELEVIPADVIGKLCRLEELLVGNSFRKWDVKDNAKVTELDNLSSLSALDVFLPDTRIMPEQSLFVGKLERYNIVIGKFDRDFFTDHSKASKALQLEINISNGLNKGIEMLVMKAEELRIEGFKGGEDMVYGLDTEGYPHLKSLRVRKSSEIKWIVNSMFMVLAPRQAFPVLETMELYDLTNLNTICHGEHLKTESFSQLTTIKVESCDTLKNLFSFSIAKNLNQLQEISIKSCWNVTEIVEGERKEENEVIEKLEFCRLFSLTLYALPDLKSFYSRKERSSSSGQGERAFNNINTKSKAVSLFNPKVSLPAMKELELEKINAIEKIWDDDQFPCIRKSNFGAQNLTSLRVWRCDKLKYAFCSSMVKSFLQLKTLYVSECGEMEAVIEGILEGETQVFPKLVSLALEDLPKLERFCSGINPIKFPSLGKLVIWKCPVLNTFHYDTTNVVGNNIISHHHLFTQKVSFPAMKELKLESISNIEKIWDDNQLLPIKMSNFDVQSLTTLTVKRCDKLEYVFCSSMIESFVQLKTLQVSLCYKMEDIVEGKLEGQVFPKLDSVQLCSLPYLKSFCSGINPIEFPSLRKLGIRLCYDLNTFHCDTTNVVGNKISHHLFNQKVIFPVLEDLFIWEMEKLERLWANQLAELSFSRLTSVELKNCRKLVNVFPSSMLTKLERLTKMKIFNCKSVEEIIFESESQLQDKGGSMQSQFSQSDVMITFEFPSLTSLALVGLRNLKSIHHKKHTASWSSLEQVRVRRCEKEIWRLIPSSVSFKYLVNLKVETCHGIIRLITHSTAKTLVQLKQMEISSCANMEEIIQGGDDDDDDYEDDDISFPKLNTLTLVDLPKLESFCSSRNHTFGFPSLEILVVDVCPKMKIFSQRDSNTPRLHYVRKLRGGYEDEGHWEGSLNSTIQQLFREQNAKA